MATAMLAFASERTVHIVHDDATLSCYVNRLSVE